MYVYVWLLFVIFVFGFCWREGSAMFLVYHVSCSLILCSFSLMYIIPIYHYGKIDLSINRRWTFGCFTIFATYKSAFVNFLCHVFWLTYKEILIQHVPRREIPVPHLCLQSKFVDIAKRLSKQINPIYSLKSAVGNFQFMQILSNIYHCLSVFFQPL